MPRPQASERSLDKAQVQAAGGGRRENGGQEVQQGPIMSAALFVGIGLRAQGWHLLQSLYGDPEEVVDKGQRFPP